MTRPLTAWPLSELLVASAAVLAACSSFGAEDDPPTSPSADAGAAVVDDAPEERDAGPAALDDGGSCPPDRPAISGTGELVAYPPAKALLLDGDLGDWSCAPFFRLDDQSAELGRYDPAGGLFVEVAVAWTAEKLYVAARHRDDSPRSGANAERAHPNDCVHLYLDGDGVVDGKYGADTRMVVFDHKNLVTEYRPTPEKSGSIPGVKSMVAKVKGGFNLEVEIDRSYLQRNGFAAGDVLRFDLAAANGTGNSSDFNRFLVWRWGETCGATCECTGEDTPNCNTLQFGDLRLSP